MGHIDTHRRPKMKTLWENYPRGTAEEVKQLIGGKVNYPWIKNTCVIRISRAFNYSGHRLKNRLRGLSTISGDDGLWYAYRVREFVEYLTRNFGPPDFSVSRKAGDASIPKAFFGKQGIIVFEVDSWSDATGHMTLWNGQRCVDNDCYWHRSKKIRIWIVPL